MMSLRLVNFALWETDRCVCDPLKSTLTDEAAGSADKRLVLSVRVRYDMLRFKIFKMLSVCRLGSVRLLPCLNCSFPLVLLM